MRKYSKCSAVLEVGDHASVQRDEGDVWRVAGRSAAVLTFSTTDFQEAKVEVGKELIVDSTKHLVSPETGVRGAALNAEGAGNKRGAGTDVPPGDLHIGLYWENRRPGTEF